MQRTTDGQSPAAKCDTGENETVEHEELDCQKYDRDKMKMMRVILTEMGCEINEVIIERTGRK